MDRQHLIFIGTNICDESDASLNYNYPHYTNPDKFLLTSDFQITLTVNNMIQVDQMTS